MAERRRDDDGRARAIYVARAHRSRATPLDAALAQAGEVQLASLVLAERAHLDTARLQQLGRLPAPVRPARQPPDPSAAVVPYT